MKSFNPILTIIFLCIFHNCNAQIHLKGYKCKFYKDQWPYTMAEMCSKKDTFRYTLYSRDIWYEFWIETGTNDIKPEDELRIGLAMCFENEHYKMTSDSLYIATGRYTDINDYYYTLYDPYLMSSVSLRSKYNDSSFSEKSKWLLSQIRSNKKGDIYLINDRNQTCQDPNEREH